jgi:hypothetical protein
MQYAGILTEGGVGGRPEWLNPQKRSPPKRSLALPDLEQTKSAVLNSLTINELVDWYCPEPRLSVIARWFFDTESTWNNATLPRQRSIFG